MSGYLLFIHINEWATTDSPDAIPISQAYTLAYLKQYGFTGRILGDYKNAPLQPAELKQVLQEHQPLALGFSVYEENMHQARLWAQYAKKIAPDLTVILGGPQTTFMPDEALLQMQEADILCRAEGETVTLALARALTDGSSLKTVPGISFVEHGRIITTDPEPMVEDLDTYPSPYLEDLVDVKGKSRVILLSSRGCTSPCTFCYTTRASGRRVRFHSLDRIIAEVQHLRTQGISDFWFADPNFAYSRDRLTSLLERLIQEAPNIQFWCQTRYNLITPELLELLKKAGARTIAFGLESADRDVLHTIKKGLQPDRLSEVIAMVQKAGIEVELFTLFGLPGETMAQAAATLDYVKSNKVAIDGNSISQQLHLFFGTPITDDPASHGITPLPMTKPAYQSICRDFATTTMTAAEIHQLSLFWRLNRQDFSDNVQTRTNLFEVAGFITANRAHLQSRPEAELLLAEIYLALEEFDGARKCIERLEKQFPDHPEVRGFLTSPWAGFKSKRRTIAAPGSRVIYDCKGLADGRPIDATVGYYQEAVLGDGRLLVDFDQALAGMRTGQVQQCEVRFPADYGNRELAGRKITFQIYIHLVQDRVEYANPTEFLENPPKNIYRLHDLPGLRENNENLYYMVLKDSVLRDLTQDLTDMFKQIDLLLKLGFRERAEAMQRMMPDDATLHAHLGRILLANGLAEESYQHLTAYGGQSNEVAINRAKALIKLERFQEAEAIVMEPKLAGEIQALDLRVGLAALLMLPITHYLDRMDDLLERQIAMMASK
jgi:radical SAM superfamily enzyme